MYRLPRFPPVAVFGFLAPNFFGFCLFLLFPLLFSFVRTFTNWTVKPGVELEWVGLRNFNDLLGVHGEVGSTSDALIAAYCF